MFDLQISNQNEPSLQKFRKISLDEMNGAKLLNRFDSKYTLHISQLQQILNLISNEYFVLEIDGTRVQTYQSVYFDTPANKFYLAHHNGKADRLKIRKREYVNSGISFFEVKIKSKKGKTNKKRIQSNTELTNISPAENHYLNDILGLKIENLEVKSKNSFNRITLVNKTFDERCTIDTNITFEKDGKGIVIQDFALIELKQGNMHMKSVLADELKKYHINKLGFSKYCMGRALSEINIKKNMFKSKILKIRKQYNLVSHQKSHDYVYSKIG